MKFKKSMENNESILKEKITNMNNPKKRKHMGKTKTVKIEYPNPQHYIRDMKNPNVENQIKFIAKSKDSRRPRKPESSVQRINSDDRSSLVNKIPLPFMYNTDKEVLEFKYVNDELKMQCPMCSKIFIKITNVY